MSSFTHNEEIQIKMRLFSHLRNHQKFQMPDRHSIDGGVGVKLLSTLWVKMKNIIPTEVNRPVSNTATNTFALWLSSLIFKVYSDDTPSAIIEWNHKVFLVALFAIKMPGNDLNAHPQNLIK